MPSIASRSNVDTRGMTQEEHPLNHSVNAIRGGLGAEPDNPAASSPYLRCPLPSLVVESPDSLRQFYNRATSQIRLWKIPGAGV